MTASRPVSGHASIAYRAATRGDAVGIAELHAVCQPKSIWSQIGGRPAEIFFEQYCAGGSEFTVIAAVGEEIVGACMGTEQPNGMKRRFYRCNATRLVRAFLSEVRRRPRLAILLARRLAKAMQSAVRVGIAAVASRPSSREEGAHMVPAHERECYMALFIVSPAWRGRQVGSIMLQHFAAEMSQRGCDWCRVHTTIENRASQRAQERAGFHCIEQRGRELTYMKRIGGERVT